MQFQRKNIPGGGCLPAIVCAMFFVLALCFSGCRHGGIEGRDAWIAKQKADSPVMKAVAHTKNADLKHPAVKDAVMAARCADLEALSVIRKNGFDGWKDPEIMIAACQTPFPVVVRAVHELGGPVDARDRSGMTALMIACRDPKNLETVKYLVSLGADVKAKDKDGKTALDRAKDKAEAYNFLRFRRGRSLK